jgi:hypothetical protein
LRESANSRTDVEFSATDLSSSAKGYYSTAYPLHPILGARVRSRCSHCGSMARCPDRYRVRLIPETGQTNTADYECVCSIVGAFLINLFVFPYHARTRYSKVVAQTLDTLGDLCEWCAAPSSRHMANHNALADLTMSRYARGVPDTEEDSGLTSCVIGRICVLPSSIEYPVTSMRDWSGASRYVKTRQTYCHTLTLSSIRSVSHNADRSRRYSNWNCHSCQSHSRCMSS